MMPRLLVYADSIAWHGILITRSQRTELQTLVEFDVCLDERFRFRFVSGFVLQPFLFKISFFDKYKRKGRNVHEYVYKYVNIKEKGRIDNREFVKRLAFSTRTTKLNVLQASG